MLVLLVTSVWANVNEIWARSVLMMMMMMIIVYYPSPSVEYVDIRILACWIMASKKKRKKVRRKCLMVAAG